VRARSAANAPIRDVCHEWILAPNRAGPGAAVGRALRDDVRQRPAKIRSQSRRSGASACAPAAQATATEEAAQSRGKAKGRIQRRSTARPSRFVTAFPASSRPSPTTGVVAISTAAYLPTAAGALTPTVTQPGNRQLARHDPLPRGIAALVLPQATESGMYRSVVFCALGSSLVLAGCSASSSTGDMFMTTKPSAAGQATLHVKSEPPGALASAPGGQSCRTPCEMRLPMTNTNVTVALDGYYSQNFPVTWLPATFHYEMYERTEEVGTVYPTDFSPNPVIATLERGSAPAPSPAPAAKRKPAPKPKTAARPTSPQPQNSPFPAPPAQ
jgi:hypothetical protein